ncbi:hypothetical protein Patl1_17343 [Pistacia atlantica]|uniref:Uncharacterized protein n=1 Tax=Pistacia atlantica TaxID=434234 RepID=A0ACC1C107_9ROSI|nr:hypothetical protein Patl1_17343 [Pistacia atlantica]
MLSTSGDTHLGWDDFDKRMVDWLAANFKRDERMDLLKDKQALQRLTKTAEKAKIELSSLTQTNISLPFITATADGPKHIETTITKGACRLGSAPVKEKVEAKLKELKVAIALESTKAMKDAMAALNQEVMQLGQSLNNQPGAWH